ncbi:MAG: hypothetical protein GC159_18990 [Phycisphaera sp.]|nr:hypothetical protein [Phycisphaera sp.]
MTPVEILALVQAARSLLELGVSQYRLAEQEGRLTDEQKAAILAAADITDDHVDTIVAAARQRLADRS